MTQSPTRRDSVRGSEQRVPTSTKVPTDPKVPKVPKVPNARRPRVDAARAPGPGTGNADTLQAALRAVADPLRSRLLRALQRDSYDVTELCELMDMPQPALSHHLRLLTQGGWLSARREGTHTFYRRALPETDAEFAALRHEIFAAIDRVDADTTMRAQMNKLRAQRHQRSQAYFAKHGQSFREQQDQIAPISSYNGALIELMTAGAPGSFSHVVEVGPGTGELLPELASRFSRVTAVESSTSMRAACNAVVEQSQLHNVRVVLADGNHLPARPAASAIVATMVVHHMPAPAEFFVGAATALQRNGRLYVVELCRHQQDWARELCGDLWLGFDADELIMWAADAGLMHLQQQYLAQRNGFRIQLHSFAAPDPTDAPKPNPSRRRTKRAEQRIVSSAANIPARLR